MKPIVLAIALLTSSVAFAQAPAKATAAPAKASADASVETSAPLPVVSTVPGKFNKEVNPFTGKPLTGEELQARIESSRMLTLALEEQLKQVTLAGEIEALPLRKQAEVTTAKLSARAEAIKLEQMDADAKEAARARRAAARAAAEAEKTAKAEAKRRASEPVAVMPEPVIPRPTLLSVMTVGAVPSAMLDFGGSTLLVADGEMSPLGPVKIVDRDTVVINGQSYKVSSSTIARFANASGMAAAPRAGTASVSNAARTAVPAGGAGGQGSAADGVPQQPAAPAASRSPAVPPEMASAVATESAAVTGMPARLPPLQLPPGVSLFPTR